VKQTKGVPGTKRKVDSEHSASRGRALEHEVRELFRAAGWSVIRGAGSKGELDIDGEPMKVDLVCSKTSRDLERTVFLVGIQCKLKTRS
jgi:Holliday junction resolvase